MCYPAKEGSIAKIWRYSPTPESSSEGGFVAKLLIFVVPVRRNERRGGVVGLACGMVPSFAEVLRYSPTPELSGSEDSFVAELLSPVAPIRRDDARETRVPNLASADESLVYVVIPDVGPLRTAF